MFFGTDAFRRTLHGVLDLAEVAVTQVEMSCAAGTVIGARMSIAAHAQRDPLSAEAAELQRTVPEKLQAFSEAAAAVIGEWSSLHRDIAEYMAYVGRSMMSGRVPAPADLIELADRTTTHGARLAGSAGGAAIVVLAPLHKTVTSNARLARRII